MTELVITGVPVVVAWLWRVSYEQGRRDRWVSSFELERAELDFARDGRWLSRRRR